MHSDPLADLLTRIRNAARARLDETHAPWSRVKEEIAKLLKDQGFLTSVAIEGEGVKKALRLGIPEDRTDLHIRRISKPGQRIYVDAKRLPNPLQGYGIALISTSQGIMTNKAAKQANLGGEVLCEVW